MNIGNLYDIQLVNRHFTPKVSSRQDVGISPIVIIRQDFLRPLRSYRRFIQHTQRPMIALTTEYPSK